MMRDYSIDNKCINEEELENYEEEEEKKESNITVEDTKEKVKNKEEKIKVEEKEEEEKKETKNAEKNNVGKEDFKIESNDIIHIKQNPQSSQSEQSNDKKIDNFEVRQLNKDNIQNYERSCTCYCCYCTLCQIISLAITAGIMTTGISLLIYFLSNKEKQNDDKDKNTDKEEKCFDGEVKKELMLELESLGYKENEDFFFDNNIYDKYAGYYIFSLNDFLNPKELLFRIQTQYPYDLEKFAGKKKMKYFIRQLKKDISNNTDRSCYFIVRNPKNVFSHNNIGLKNLFSIKLLQEGENKLTTMEGMFANCKNLISVDLSIADISNVINMSSIFLNCEKLKNIKIKWELSNNVKTMSRAFEGCENLEQINLENIKTHNVEDMSNMFKNCKALTSINLYNFDTQNVTNMSFMFSGCENIIDITGLNNWKTLYCENMEGIFKNCIKLKTIPEIQNWNVKKVKNMNEMFCNCREIVNITLYWNTDSVITLNNMFAGCSKVTDISIPGFNIVQSASKNNILSQCYNLNKMCVPENESIVQEITYLWGGRPTFVDKCYKKNHSVVCPSSNFKEEMHNRLLSLGLKEGADFFWYAIKNDKAFFIMQINSDNCNLSCKKLHIKNESIFKGLTKIESITFLQEGENKLTTMEGMFANCKNLISVDLSIADISNVINMSSIFLNCEKLKNIKIKWELSNNVKTMSRAFEGCENLEQINLENIKTHNVEDMSNMFKNCKALTSINLYNFDTKNVANMSFMFYGCNSLNKISITNFNVNKVTTMDYMFAENGKLKEIYFWNNNKTNSLTSMKYMFYGCTSLTKLNLENFNTNKVTDMSYCFYHCSSLHILDISTFNSNRLITIDFMFAQCSNLMHIIAKGKFSPDINVSSVGIFANDVSLVKVCMRLNTKLYDNLMPIWGQHIIFQDGCYAKKIKLYSSMKSYNDSNDFVNNKSTSDIAKKMILQNIKTQKKIKNQKEYINNIFNCTTQINNNRYNTFPMLINMLRNTTGNNIPYLP